MRKKKYFLLVDYIKQDVDECVFIVSPSLIQYNNTLLILKKEIHLSAFDK